MFSIAKRSALALCRRRSICDSRSMEASLSLGSYHHTAVARNRNLRSPAMTNPVFGEIVYEREGCWRCRCRLLEFTQCGRRETGALEAPDASYLEGWIPLTVFDESGAGPTADQEAGFLHLV